MSKLMPNPGATRRRRTSPRSIQQSRRRRSHRNNCFTTHIGSRHFFCEQRDVLFPVSFWGSEFAVSLRRQLTVEYIQYSEVGWKPTTQMIEHRTRRCTAAAWRPMNERQRTTCNERRNASFSFSCSSIVRTCIGCGETMTHLPSMGGL